MEIVIYAIDRENPLITHRVQAFQNGRSQEETYEPFEGSLEDVMKEAAVLTYKVLRNGSSRIRVYIRRIS